MDGDYTARAKLEAAAIIDANGGVTVDAFHTPYAWALGLVAQAWLAGYRAALEDHIGGAAA